METELTKSSLFSKEANQRGKIMKGLSKPFELNTTMASIPSNYETILTKSTSTKGFGSSSNRFIPKAIDMDIPGPGHYNKINENQNLSTSISFNKKRKKI